MRKVQLMISAALVMASAPAFAQGAATPDATPQASEEAAPQPGDIIVTATQRSERLSDVPIAVSAVSGESLANTGANDVRALNQLAPSLLVSGATSEVNFSARIRGVGTVGENAGLESSVALFIDGVYRSRTGVGLSELGEIERVEVLRGPQGTLFGRNASAGLINIVTKSPSFNFGFNAAATYGNYNYLRFDAGVTGPLIADKLAFRLDGVSQKRNGFIDNVTPGGQDVNDRQRFLLRGQLLFTPTSDISLRVIGDYSERNELCCGAVNYGPNQNVRLVGGNLTFEPNTLLPVLQALGANIPVANDGNRFVRAQSVTPGFNYISNTKDVGVSSELKWDLGGVNLTGITSYRDYKNRQGQDSDYTALDIIRRTALDRRFRTFTQELRLQGQALDKRLNFLIGGYFANEILNVQDDFKYGNDYERYANCVLAEGQARGIGNLNLINTADSSCINRTLAATQSATIRGLAGLSPLSAAGFDPRGGFYNIAAAIGFRPPAGSNLLNGTGVVNNNFRQESRNFAFFTHNVFDIVRDKISLTLGARYTNERKTLSGSFNTNNNFCGAIRASGFAAFAGLPCVVNNTSGPGISRTDPNRQTTESQFTGTAVLSFKPTKNLLVYGSVSRGYKAGGYNLDTSALDVPSTNAAILALPAFTVGNGRPEVADLQFAPETVKAFEVGFKYDGRQFNLNAAAFYQSFKNFQLNTFNGINFEVTNVNSCKDNLNGADRDFLPSTAAAFATGACAAGRLGPGLVSKGFELEAAIFPARHLAVNLGLTYALTEYQNNLVGINGRPFAPTSFQLPQRQISNAPEYVVTGGVGYSPDLGNNGLSGLIYLDFRYQSDVNTGSDLDIEKVQDGFAVVNGRLGIYGRDKKWGIEVWGQNLLNETYQQIAADAPLQGGGTTRGVALGSATANQLFIAFPGEPRTYGITLKVKY
ncbi:MAG: TonB-dependent receptor [Sphingomonadaceae bacterium]